MSVDNRRMTVVLLLRSFLSLPLLQPPCLGIPIVSPGRREQQGDIAVDRTPFVPFEKTSSKIEDFDFGPQDSLGQTGFISPSSLHTLYIEGSALAECKLVCWLVLSMIVKKTGDEASPGLRSPFTTKSCSLKSLMIFSGLKAGKYLLSTRCDADQLCYTDPAEKIFDVITNDGGMEVVHLGSLVTFSRLQRNITEERAFESLDAGSYYSSAHVEAWRKYWQTIISIGVISSLVGLGFDGYNNAEVSRELDSRPGIITCTSIPPWQCCFGCSVPSSPGFLF